MSSEEFEFLIIKVLEQMQRAEMEQVHNLRAELPPVPDRLPVEQVMDEDVENEGNNSKLQNTPNQH